MKLVYGISKWNNPGRARTRHIDNGEGLPLCATKQKVSSWATEDDDPQNVSCGHCIDVNMQLITALGTPFWQTSRPFERITEALEVILTN